MGQNCLSIVFCFPLIYESVVCRIREKEQDAVDKERQRVREQIGSGVSREAQLLFNGLAKTSVLCRLLVCYHNFMYSSSPSCLLT